MFSKKIPTSVLIALASFFGSMIGVSLAYVYLKSPPINAVDKADQSTSAAAPPAKNEMQRETSIEPKVQLSPLEQTLQLGISNEAQFREFVDNGGLEFDSSWREFRASSVETGYSNGKLSIFRLKIKRNFRSDLLASINNVKDRLEDYCGWNWDSPVGRYYRNIGTKNACLLELIGNSVVITVNTRSSEGTKEQPHPKDKNRDESKHEDKPPTEQSRAGEFSDTLNPVYPKMSLRLGEAGQVVLKIRINQDRLVEEVQIASSSGFQRLDQAAIEAVKKWRVPESYLVNFDKDSWYSIPINFKI
jgi:TonB family protein